MTYTQEEIEAEAKLFSCLGCQTDYFADEGEGGMLNCDESPAQLDEWCPVCLFTKVVEARNERIAELQKGTELIAAHMRQITEASEVEKHQKALRYFLQRETSLGMYCGEVDLNEVRRAMHFFAYAEPDLKEALVKNIEETE